MERVNLGTLSGKAQSTRMRLLCRFQSLSSLLTTFAHPLPSGTVRETSLQMETLLTSINASFKRVTPTWFSDFFSDFSFS